MAPYPGMEEETMAVTCWSRIDKFPMSEYTPRTRRPLHQREPLPLQPGGPARLLRWTVAALAGLLTLAAVGLLASSATDDDRRSAVQ